MKKLITIIILYTFISACGAGLPGINNDEIDLNQEATPTVYNENPDRYTRIVTTNDGKNRFVLITCEGDECNDNSDDIPDESEWCKTGFRACKK